MWWVLETCVSDLYCNFTIWNFTQRFSCSKAHKALPFRAFPLLSHRPKQRGPTQTYPLLVIAHPGWDPLPSTTQELLETITVDLLLPSWLYKLPSARRKRWLVPPCEGHRISGTPRPSWASFTSTTSPLYCRIKSLDVVDSSAGNAVPSVAFSMASSSFFFVSCGKGEFSNTA